MAEILKEWLTERLQTPINWDAAQFGEMMRNGNVIADLLLSYNVITEEKHYLIRPNNTPDDIQYNWKYLQVWLRDIDIDLTEVEVNNLMDGKGSSLLRLFYQMFLHLDKRDRTNFIKHEREKVSRLVEKMGHRFKVEKVPPDEASFFDHLSKPLLNERHFIDWQRRKVEQIKDTYDFVRHKYKKMVENIEESQTPIKNPPKLHKKSLSKDKKEMDKFALRQPFNYKNYTYEELLEMDEKATEGKRSIVDTEWAKNYMENLHTRLLKKADSDEFQKEIGNVVSGSLWNQSVDEEEAQLDTELAVKVMKLSHFEKQMCTQIMETKQQARNLMKNRIEAERQFTDERKQHFTQFFDNVKEKLRTELSEIDFEKKRQNKLHEKLYAEKLKRKRQHYYAICYDTMLSIVDYVTKYGYYKRLLEDEIPQHFIHEWKNLYYKQQPIFDILDSMEDLLKGNGLEEELVPEEEEIVRLELDRQQVLNESEFKDYHNYTYPWILEYLIPNYDPESEERKFEYLGTRVLGHVVYTLLTIKYPYPPARPPADLPPFTVKSLLRGLPDRAITAAIQKLLDFQKVFVVRLEAAINFCLKTFKTEMIGCKDIELSYDKFAVVASEDGAKDLIKLMKDDDIANRTSDSTLASLLGITTANTKQTQTPKTIPEEEITLSVAADLGRYGYQTLNFGDSLTDHLLAAMIVEYIKDQVDIKGFVIVDYPNTYRQAQILEDTFAGRSPPDEDDLDDRDDIYLEESIAKHRKKERDEYKDIRVSKLVSDPHKRKYDTPFESYFTSYINLKNTEDILQELMIWDLTEENSEFIDRFYAALGINYSLYYEVIDKDFLAQICKCIIGDYSLPPKSCDTLFGENVMSLLDFYSSDDKRMKSKMLKPEVSNSSKLKVRRLSKIQKSNSQDLFIASDSNEAYARDEAVQGSEEVPEEENSKDDDRSTVSSVEPPMLAGEEYWEYGELPIPEIIGTALASCWEQVERTYIRDMQQLFFAKRLQMNCLIPYTRFIKDKMEQIITLPSKKQDLVSTFQKDYNDFENDWRDIHIARNEWHCRIKTLQTQLCNICDERKKFATAQRQALVNDNWTLEELITMVNTYISCVQVELNRSILTFQALHDFYFTMIKKMPPNDRMTSYDLVKINREADDISVGKKGGEDKVFRQLKAAFIDLQTKNISIDYTNNPFNMIIENNVRFALKVIKDTNDSFRSIISKEYTDISRIITTQRKKDDSSTADVVSSEEFYKQNALKCTEEWIMGINGEMYRASLRILALQYKCYADMKLFNDLIYKTFTDIQNDIDTYYENEVRAVDHLCKYFQLAVEDGRRIPETLILKHDTFIIDPNLLQIAPPAPSVDTDITREVSHRTEFKISQLAQLRSSFKVVAPTGIILQKAFIYLMQDFLYFSKETCDGPVIPESWVHMDPELVSKLVLAIFGETVYVDWRDFLIYCLNVRFPSTDELLDLRKRYRCVDLESTELISRNYYMKIDLWFEAELNPEDKFVQLRKNLIKNFLFELYEVEFNKMNYSAFLLAFCKSISPQEGFASALSMAVGKRVGYSMLECEDVVCRMIKDKLYKDECLACAKLCAEEYLDEVLTQVIDICLGTVIHELPYDPEDSKRARKKIKSASKDKKESVGPKNGTSPRELKTSAPPTPHVTTFICPPCEETPAPEEARAEEVVEEEQIVPQVDPNLAYSVSQEVIWKVLRACLPWHFELLPEEKKTPYINKMKKILSKLENDTSNGDIFICKLVNEPFVCKVLNKVMKFTAINLVDVVRKISG